MSRVNGVVAIQKSDIVELIAVSVVSSAFFDGCAWFMNVVLLSSFFDDSKEDTELNRHE